MKLSITHNGETFNHGDKVTCNINGVIISDAKLSISNTGALYICQNHIDGSKADNLLGYKYSWIFIINELSNYEVFNLKIVNSDALVNSIQGVIG